MRRKIFQRLLLNLQCLKHFLGDYSNDIAIGQKLEHCLCAIVKNSGVSDWMSSKFIVDP